tara:strand:- start:164 stop:367 length:204 start_codon:yes stop_codon:yes gene_type:complete
MLKEGMTWKKRKCPFCEKSFMRLRTLIDHAVIMHSKNITWINTWNKEKKKMIKEIFYPKSHKEMKPY